MIKPHAPFRDGSKHVANEYCQTCHGAYDSRFWDGDGRGIIQTQDQLILKKE